MWGSGFVARDYWLVDFGFCFGLHSPAIGLIGFRVKLRGMFESRYRRGMFPVMFDKYFSDYLISAISLAKAVKSLIIQKITEIKRQSQRECFVFHSGIEVIQLWYQSQSKKVWPRFN